MLAAPLLTEEIFHRWKDLALDLCRAGGSPRNLIPLVGLTESQWQNFMDFVHEQAKPRRPVERRPILIPPTSPTSYVSFRGALKLSVPGEHTGDLHFQEYFFGFVEPTVAPLSGPGGIVDSTPGLGSKGVRDMGRITADLKIQRCNGPVYVANHYRALADIALDSLLELPVEELRDIQPKSILSACEVNDMLNSEEAEIEHLVEEYLKRLRGRLECVRRATYDRWLLTIVPA